MRTDSRNSFAAMVARSGLCSFLMLNVAGAEDLTEGDWKRLNSGDVVVQSEEQDGKGRVAATIVIDQDVEAIWQVMLDCDGAPEFVPNLRRCKVIGRASDESPRAH